MTGQGGTDEPEAVRALPPPVTWRPTDVRDLLEARLVDGDGSSWYAGYIVRRAGEGDDEWHGYSGIAHTFVGVGRRETVQAAVERAAREAEASWAARLKAARDTRA